MKRDSASVGFVSYRSDDLRFVRDICERLLASGNTVWFNEYRVPPNHYEEFKTFISQGIDEATWGLVFASDSYCDSQYCEDELELLLKRQPEVPLFFVQRDSAPKFQEKYSDLADKLIPIRDMQTVFDALYRAGMIFHKPSTIYVDHCPKRFWFLKAIGACFNAGFWQIDTQARWPVGQQMLDLAGEPWQEPTAFVATIEGRDVRLNVHCCELDAALTSQMLPRIDTLEGILCYRANKGDDDDDRERFREELKHFRDEVITNVDIVRLEGAAPLSNLPSKVSDFAPIGVHVFDTEESSGCVRNVYKHRLFSYRLGGRIYRCYKLCLPQPQLRKPVAVRFLFDFDDDLRAYLSTIPYCDQLVDSFGWMGLETRPTLSVEDVRRAARKAKGEQK